MYCQASKHQKEKRNHKRRNHSDGNKGGEPRCWDRGSECGVIESAKGGGMGVKEELEECWDDDSLNTQKLIKNSVCPTLFPSLASLTEPALIFTLLCPSYTNAQRQKPLNSTSDGPKEVQVKCKRAERGWKSDREKE